MGNGQQSETLEKELAELTETGIRADVQRLKADMCRQFANDREWVREFAANAADAGATRVRFSGRETEDTVTVVVEDDGCGMDRQGVIDFMTLFRSPERGTQDTRIGRHGIGKLSVAAVPGQCGFSMVTSTGTECWQLRMGSLLDDTPVKLERVAAIRHRGTRFEIAFARRVPLREELSLIRDVLYKYCRFLRTDIAICMLAGDSDSARPKWVYVNDEWAPRHGFGMGSTHLRLAGRRFEVVLSLEPGGHELYQNRVLVSTHYNLFSCDLATPLLIPHIQVRVDSPDFEVPFGRHCLTNEEVLRPLSTHLRTKTLPAYFASLCSLHGRDLLCDYGVAPHVVEEIACAMMSHDPDASRVWSKLRLFRVCNGPRASLASLYSAVRRHGQIFFEDKESPGIDYAAFPAPVLSSHQPAGALDLLRKVFPTALVDLTVKDVVLEAPIGSVPELKPREKLFQRFLCFSPDAIHRARQKNADGSHRAGSLAEMLNAERLARLAGLCEEAIMAKADLEQVKWRVSYLVQRDGKTPCRSHRFLLKGDSVVVNLNHPDVIRLLQLSEKAPALAGHWGLAMCLTDTNKILPHLTPAAREDLILVDAMAKCGATASQGESVADEASDLSDPSEWDFHRDLQDGDFGIE